MRKKKSIIFYLYLFAINFVAAQGGILADTKENNAASQSREFPDISLKLREEKVSFWVKTLSEKMSEKGFNKKLLEITPDVINLQDFNQTSYRIKDQGVIKFLNGEKIVLVMHSSHDDAEIGDMILAFTDKGEMFANQGHVCGGIIHFIRACDCIPDSKEEFFNYFYSDTDDKKWIKSDSLRVNVKDP
ncbi:MAG: hypothetical protein IPL55_14320 [Saprospiraceae bacterium]|jgi:hypothetical protein|nr:hypothetical protein [Saprospiraceae bacterium]